MLFDLRGHGESEAGKVSGGEFEQRDVLGAIDYVIEEGVSAERIGLLGFGLGGALALLAASQDSRVQAVVADTAFTDLSDLIVYENSRRTRLPGWVIRALIPGTVLAGKMVYGIDISTIAPVKVIGQLDYPVLLIHGRTTQGSQPPTLSV